MSASGQQDTAKTLTGKDRIWSLGAVIFAMANVTFIIGLTFPLLALILKRQGVDAGLIGISTAVQGAAILFIAPFAPRIVARLGPNWSMAVGMGGSALIVALLPLWPNIWAWFPLRFALGAVSSLLWIASEAWINSVAQEQSRGRVISLYGIAGSAGFTLGPLLLSIVGTQTNTAFYVATAALALPCLPLLRAPTHGIRFTKTDEEEKRDQDQQANGTRQNGWLRVLLAAPAPLLITFIFAGEEEAMHTFFTLFAMSLGEPEVLALRLISAIGLGGILLGYPLGWLADKVDRLKLLTVMTVVILATTLAIPLAISVHPLNYLYFFFLGGILNGTYTTGMTLIGQRFEGHDLVTASTLTTTLWGVGAMAGPLAAGYGMQWWDPYGMIVAIALIIILYLPVPIWEWARAAGRKTQEAAPAP